MGSTGRTWHIFPQGGEAGEAPLDVNAHHDQRRAHGECDAPFVAERDLLTRVSS